VWSLSLKTAPTLEPFDAEYAKVHSRIQGNPASEDIQIDAAIQAARLQCETFTHRQLLPATWTLYLDSWWEEGVFREGAIFLPLPPLRAVASVKYRDGAGTLQTWSTSEYTAEVPTDLAVISPTAQRARVFPNYGITWPVHRCQPRAIEIEFSAGWADPSKIPQGLIAGMLLMVAELYERREEATTGTIVTPNLITAERLWWPYRAY